MQAAGVAWAQADSVWTGSSGFVCARLLFPSTYKTNTPVPNQASYAVVEPALRIQT
jgi:hypothetical protein